MTERLATVVGELANRPGFKATAGVRAAYRVAVAASEEIRRLRLQLDLAERDAIRPLAEVEREEIERAVRICGSREAAARRLGIGVATIYRKLKQYAVMRRMEENQ